jgi:hypothetical protein
MDSNAIVKSSFRRAALWAALIAIVLLTVMSIYAAFLGDDKAKEFFNSIPIAVYWLIFAVLLIVAIMLFPRLIRVPWLLLIHAGCILVLAGGMWGSQAGHKIQKALFGIDKIRTGQMAIYEGQSENRVTDEDGQTRGLPFSIRLNDFRIEYYQPGTLQIQTSDGIGFKVSTKTGQEFFLGQQYGSIVIVRVFKNFRMTIDGDKKTATDAPGPDDNPAVEVLLKNPDGTTTTKYVSERFAGHIQPGDMFLLTYQRPIRDYISEVDVIKDGAIVAHKNIEVNRPLHFGGYFFTQHSYDEQAGQYTVLGVASDTGLSAVYVGYVALCIGLFRHLWVKAAAGKSKQNGD